MFNQTEVDSFDQHLWRKERQILHSRVETFCRNHQLKFCTHSLSQNIRSSAAHVIVSMWLFDLIGDKDYWSKIDKLCQEVGKKVFVVTDNIIDNDFTFANIEFVFCHQFLGMTASYNEVNTNLPPTKLYNCFIQRVCSVRQSWFYFLHYFNLIHKGYVSLLMKQLTNYSTLTGKDLFDHIHYHYKLDQLSHFDAAYRSTRDQIPFRNFEETENLIPLILDSKYSLILETYAAEDDVGRFCVTEKAFRALQLQSIPLLFLQKHCLSKLKNLGLQFGSYLHAIDPLPWQQRQLALLNILVEDSIDFDAKELYNQCQHNRALLLGWKSEYQRLDFFDNFFHKVVSV